MAFQAGDRSEHVLDVSMTPVFTLNSRYRTAPSISNILDVLHSSLRNVARAKCMRFCWQEHQHRERNEQHVFCLYPHSERAVIESVCGGEDRKSSC